MQVSITRATAADQHQVLQMAAAFHLEDGHPLASTSPQAILLLLNDHPLGQVYLIQMNDQSVGYFVLCYTMSIEFGGVVTILDDLYLTIHYRRRGIGKQVLHWIENFVKQKKSVQIFLEVENKNAAALSFYKKFGFSVRERKMLEKLY